MWRGSNFLDLLSDDNGVVASYLLRPHLPVVERAVVLVAVSVHGAEQPTTTALKSCKINYLVTNIPV